MQKDEYNHYWKTIMETMTNGLMIVDTDGVIVEVNPAMEKITEFSKDELIGSDCTILGCDSCSGVRANGKGNFCTLFRDGHVEGWRCRLTTKSGKQTVVMKNARILKNEKDEIVGGVETLTDLKEMEKKNRVIQTLKRQLRKQDSFEGMIGNSSTMKRVFEMIASASQSDVPVVITGESGTGKELAARAVHRLGGRKKSPLMPVNCAALNEQLLESELFGHVKGAFTGADRNRVGRFEAAQNGSIFLDEIAETPVSVQVKLLRVIQEKQIERVGDHRPISINARIIAATNKDLLQLINKGLFRQDLYYRLGVFTINIPPLRERPGDIPLLVEYFANRLKYKTDKPITGLSNAAMRLFMAHSWPGNVRELINALEYAFVVCPEGEIRRRHLPDAITSNNPCAGASLEKRPPDPEAKDPEHILQVLADSGGNKAEAARRLGISRVTLWKRLKKMQAVSDSEKN